MILWDYHDVNFTLRLRMVKRQDLLVFPDHLHFDLAGEDIFTVPIPICHSTTSF
jgi:hypothetical protein